MGKMYHNMAPLQHKGNWNIFPNYWESRGYPALWASDFFPKYLTPSHYSLIIVTPMQFWALSYSSVLTMESVEMKYVWFSVPVSLGLMLILDLQPGARFSLAARTECTPKIPSGNKLQY
jgi:hypothetical protein